MSIKRRSVLKGMLATGASIATIKAPAVHAQAAPFKLGLLTVKTGPLAQGGIQMEQGVLTYLKEKNNTMAGRKVEFFSADTGGSPAGTKTKVQELVERDKVDVILGPLAAFELLAITDYIAQVQDAAVEPRRRRGHDAAPAQSVFPARVGDLRAGDASDGGIRRQGAEAEAHRHHLRRLRLRPRADGRIPEGVRGQRRQDPQEAVAAAGHAGLHALRRADRRLRRRLPGLRRIESAALHEDVCRAPG